MGNPSIPFGDYIVFVDESGSPTLSPLDPSYPVFVLSFCVFEKSAYADAIQPAVKRLKFEFFGHDMTVLHSHDIRKPKGDFLILLDPNIRQRFLARLDQVVSEADFQIIAHVIDKARLIRRYKEPFDPYHIALRMCMEQLNCFLRENGQTGKLTHIIAELRGKLEDRELRAEFVRVTGGNHDWGMASQFPLVETPFDLRFVEKKINSTGLQLADLTGQPIGRNYLNSAQPNHAFDVLKPKVYRQIWPFPPV